MDSAQGLGLGASPRSAVSAAEAAAAIKRRAPIACRRCRRLRSKCIHERARPPCKACLSAGLGPDDCIFPLRGHPDNDRDYRHPRARAEKLAKQSAKAQRVAPDGLAVASMSIDDWDNLPPLDHLIDVVNRFTRYYFQLGFIPKQQFLERLRRDHRSVNPFLLLSILSISARLSPALQSRYGNGVKAAEYFMERASAIAIGEIYQEPTLERCQAFYLLSIAQQGSGLRNKSHINMGVSLRMAQLMQLHREETYQIQNPTPELIVRAESARRTLWMLHSQDSLHSGPLSPVSLSVSDITALLPCNEEDFANGREPESRAALEGTPPAVDNPALISDPNRSLFATLMQAHHLWGIVGRRAVSSGKSSHPWEPSSEFSQTEKRLRDWEQRLPREHMWSAFLLKAHKAAGQDLAYLCLTMTARLCNIVLRRPYLVDIINNNDTKDPQKLAFFSTLSTELFRNVGRLYEQIDAQFTDRTPDESVGAQMAAFCVYSCGLFSTYLCKYPNICQDATLVRDGPMMLQRTMAILTECEQVWPLAARWAEALEKFSRDPNSAPLAREGSMADGRDPVPQPFRQLPSSLASSTATSNAPDIPTTDASAITAPLSSSLPNPVIPSLGTQPDPSGPLSLHSSHHGSPRNPLMRSLPVQNPRQRQQQQQLPQRPQYQHHQQQPISHSQPLPHMTSPNLQVPPPPPPPPPYHPRSNMYLPQQPSHPHISGAAVNGLGMLIEAFDSHQQQHPPYAMSVAAGLAPPPPPSFYPSPLGPGNDGFETELQFYIDGVGNNSGWMPLDGWLEEGI